MKTSDKLTDNFSNCNKYPCIECMNYIARDMKQSSILNHNDKMQILFYLQKISDRKVICEIIDLLKDISAQY